MEPVEGGEEEEGNGGRKEKGLVRESVWMTHRHEQLIGDWLWERGVGVVEGGKREKMGQPW